MFFSPPNPLKFVFPIWGFAKIRGTLLWGPYNKDPTMGTILGSPIFGNSYIRN